MKNIMQRILYFLLALVTAIAFAACGESTERPQPTVEINLPFKETVVSNGAGATFPAALYQAWFLNLNRKEPRLQINFQAAGSGAGIERLTQGVVDFAASDVAMTDAEIAKVPRGVLMLPMTAGTVVLAYNLPGVEELKLSREALANIFLGKITNWNDPTIAQANPGVQLPDQRITVVHRSDGSGTTAVFTMHLSAISPEWKNSVGTGRSVEWPRGAFLGGRGNDGVASVVGQTVGAIGYMEYSFATKTNLAMAALENKAGKFIAPSSEAGSEALSQVELPDNLRAFIDDPAGEGSYPIVTYTWMLLYEKYDDPNKAIAMEAMIQYGLTDGQKLSPTLGFIELPPNVIQRVAAAADAVTPDFKITIPG